MIIKVYSLHLRTNYLIKLLTKTVKTITMTLMKGIIQKFYYLLNQMILSLKNCEFKLQNRYYFWLVLKKINTFLHAKIVHS